MNVNRVAFRVSSSASLSRFSRLLLSLLLGILLTAPAQAAGGSLGQALALRAALRSIPPAVKAQAQAAAPASFGLQRTPNGRALLPRSVMHSGAIRRDPRVAASNVVPIPGAVQTFDVNNPPPAFRPLIGFQGQNADGQPVLTNNPANPPLYQPNSVLLPTNLTPVWSADETFLVFSSNRTLTGGIGPRFHLWAISINGGEAYQITTSTGQANGGEFFPALSSNDGKLAFTSDAQSPGVQNLFVQSQFSYSLLVAMNNTAVPVDVSNNDPATGGITSVTLRTSGMTPSPQLTGFDQVQRPVFSPSNDGLIVFSARSVSGINTGHFHIYFLNTISGGFDPANVSYPGKLTDGPADDTDPAWSKDGQFIAIASTTSGLSGNPNNSFGPNPPGNVQDPNQSQSLTAAPSNGSGNRSIFLLSGGSNGTGFGLVPTSLQSTGGRITLAGSDNFGPAWSFQNRNLFLNPAPGFEYLAFGRGASPTAKHDIFYLQTLRNADQGPTNQRLTPEGTPPGGGAANNVIKLNTDDNAGQTGPSGNVYNDAYPAWSPFLSVFSITYSSERTVTYNDPTTSFPVEVAVSVPRGGTAATSDTTAPSYAVGSGYAGIFESQVLNLDPPSLLRFNPTEIVHVQARQTGAGASPISGVSAKLGINPGQGVTFTIRLSSREAGINNTTGPNGGPRVYLQIKDPDSKYQDAQAREHKVFARDLVFNNQTNRPINELNSGSANLFLKSALTDYGGAFNPYGTADNARFGGPLDFIDVNPNNQYRYPSYGTPVQGAPAVDPVFPRGVHGGHWPFPNGNNPSDTFIFSGKDGGGTNPGLKVPIAGLPGGDPRLFIPVGSEYEAQFINPQFAASGNLDGNTQLQDYRSPFYLAGIDDQGAFSGGTFGVTTGVNTQADRPVANGTDVNGNFAPAEWLQFQKSPVQDNLGGVLYTVNWTTPTSASDFFLDVIAFDTAAYPALPAGTSAFSGGKTNWRIYDNVGGFSTVTDIGGGTTNVLVVSDYALGQKFAGSTFGGQNLNLNLVPKQFGTESYITDVDVNVLPDSVFAGIPTSATSYLFNPVIQGYALNTLNGLGVGSFIDSTIDDGSRRDGASNPPSQRYSIWRILARGPVPQSILNAYLPRRVSQPAIVDSQSPDPIYRGIPAATVLDAQRCVVWLSPYTGDLLADPGTLDDPGTPAQNGATARPSTVSVLRNYVLGDGTAANPGGGRLFVTGQDVGSSLTVNGTVANTTGGFLPDVLNATLQSPGGGSNTLSATANRITGNSNYDATAPGDGYLTVAGTFPVGFRIDGGFLPFQAALILGNQQRNDASLSQIPPNRIGVASVQGQIDTIAPVNGATVAATYNDVNGPAALVFHDDPYRTGPTAKPGTVNGGTGSRTVYAAFGLEAMGADVFASDAPNPSSNPAYDLIIPPVAPHNPRPEILHNIINYLRTGSVSGTINTTAGSGNGTVPVEGVTVYLKPITGAAPPTRAAFSSTTDSSGGFTISGVEPGTYTLVAYKAGYVRAFTNNNVAFTVEGGVSLSGPRGATLTIQRLNPGSIAGNVLDVNQKPIAGATVTFTSQDKSVTKSTVTYDGSRTGQPPGAYFVDNVAVATYTATATGPLNSQGTAEYLVATAPDKPFDTGVPVQPSTTTQPVNFTLIGIPATISGLITNANTGAPIAGATVTATNTTTNAVFTTQSNADGTYLFDQLPAAQTPTTYTITAVKAGFAPNTITPPPVQLGSTQANQNVALTPIPPGSVSGTVVDALGPPIAGATVTLTATDGTILTGTTDAAGAFTIAGVPAGTYSGTAVGPNNSKGKPTTTTAPAQPIIVTAGQNTGPVTFTVNIISPSFSGTVTNAKTTAPISNAVVTVVDSTGKTATTVSTDTTGKYSTGALPPGTYTLTASQPGFASKSIGPVAVENGDVLTGQDFALTPVDPGSITGTVKDTRGLAVAAAVVTFQSVDGSVTRTATTDAAGNFLIPPAPAVKDVPASDYTGTAVGPNNANGSPEYQPSAPQRITVSPGQTTGPVNFVLTANLASVSGTVRDAQTGTALAGITLTLTDSAGATVLTTNSLVDGTYAFTGIAAGQSPAAYTVTATAPSGFFDASLTLSLSLGDRLAGQDLALNEKGSLYGLTTDASNGQPLSGVTITVTTQQGQTVVTTPTPLLSTAPPTNGPDGKPQNYTAALTPGTYFISASKSNFDAPITKTVTITNAQPVRVDFALLSSIGTLGGIVTDSTSSAPVGSATVTVTNASAQVVGTFTTTSSSTPAPDGGQLNYSGQLPKGVYTVTVTKGSRTTASQTITVKGGQFNRLDFTGTANGLPALFTYPAGLNFLSTPYDYSAIGFDGLFGNLNTAPAGAPPNGNRSNVAVWNPLVGAYALDPNAPADSLRLGVGYWVFLKNPVSVTQQGAIPTTAYVAVGLNPTWNQIGVPSTTPVPVSNLRFNDGRGGTISFAQAVSSQFRVVGPTLYYYDGASTYRTVGAGGTLVPGRAYWMQAFVSGTVQIPTSGTPAAAGQ